MGIQGSKAWPFFRMLVTQLRKDRSRLKDKPRLWEAKTETLSVAYQLAAEYLNERSCARDPAKIFRLTTATDVAMMFDSPVPSTVEEVLELLDKRQ